MGEHDFRDYEMEPQGALGWRWAACCTCGWVGPPRWSEASADVDHERHVADLAAAVGSTEEPTDG